MPVEYMPCKAEHLRYISLQEHDKMYLAQHLTEDFKTVLNTEFALSAWANNKCIAAAGIAGVWPGTGLAWAILGTDSGPYMKSLIRKIKQGISISVYPRIEMRVTKSFVQGHRLAMVLGFTLEAALMRKSGALSEDQSLYAIVR